MTVLRELMISMKEFYRPDPRSINMPPDFKAGNMGSNVRGS